MEFFHPENFIKYTQQMGEGMLTIIIVMLVIITVTAILNKVTSAKK